MTLGLCVPLVNFVVFKISINTVCCIISLDYTHSHACKHTHVHMHTHTHIYTQVYTHTHMYIQTHVHKCTPTHHMHTHTHVHTHTHMRAHTHTHTHTHTHSCYSSVCISLVSLFVCVRMILLVHTAKSFSDANDPSITHVHVFDHKLQCTPNYSVAMFQTEVFLTNTHAMQEKSCFKKHLSLWLSRK